MTDTLIISSQGQITIPKKIRNEAGIKPGVKIKVYLKKSLQGNVVILEPQNNTWSKKLAGSGRNLWNNSNEYIANERKSWEK